MKTKRKNLKKNNFLNKAKGAFFSLFSKKVIEATPQVRTTQPRTTNYSKRKRRHGRRLSSERDFFIKNPTTSSSSDEWGNFVDIENINGTRVRNPKQTIRSDKPGKKNNTRKSNPNKSYK